MRGSTSVLPSSRGRCRWDWRKHWMAFTRRMNAPRGSDDIAGEVADARELFDLTEGGTAR